MAALKLRVRDALPHAELKRFHVKRPALHLAYTARQFGIIAVCSYAL